MYVIPLVTLQMWMNDVKYNQVLNQTLVPPGVNSQATLQSGPYPGFPKYRGPNMLEGFVGIPPEIFGIFMI